jgi:HAD superfamily phosphoserine phosphatase-like hydrolase
MSTSSLPTAPLSLKALAFVESVVELRPQLAVFDCDGTLWKGDSGSGFFDWELERGLIDPETAKWIRARYADYKAGKVDEDTMCGEMVTIHRGLTREAIEREAAAFFAAEFDTNIFPEMREVVRRLNDAGCEIWAVSSTNDWVVIEGVKRFGIPADRVLAASVFIENDRATDRLVRIPSGAGKAMAIREVVKRTPDAAFGNSVFDTEMLALARHPFAIDPTPELERTAKERGWTMYFPDHL